MPEPVACPRCSSGRLSVLYFDAAGKPIGGHLHCPVCGPRHNQELVPSADKRGVRGELLQRKAS